MNCTKLSTCTGISEKEVKDYLQNNPKVVEDYLLTSATEAFIDGVLQKKLRAEAGDNDVASAKLRVKQRGRRSTIYTDTGIQAMSRKILNCTRDEDIYERLYEISQLIKTSIDAEHCLLFAVENSEKHIAIFEPTKGCLRFGKVGEHETVAGHVAKEKVPLNLESEELVDDGRFPKGIGIEEHNKCHVMSIPLLLDCGSPYVVIQFLRRKEAQPFNLFQFELVNAVMTWIMACLQKMKLNKVSLL